MLINISTQNPNNKELSKVWALLFSAFQ